MFKLHDKTRRVLTLLIFLVFGPALLTLVLTWVVLHRSSFTRAGWEQTLSRVTGKHVEIEKIEFPMPGVVRFLQCRIIEQETGATLVYIPQMELIDVIGEIPVAEIQDNKPFQRSFGESVHYLFSMLRNEKKRYRHCDIPSLSCFETAIAGAKSAIGRLITQTAAIKSSIRGGEPFDTDVKPFVLQIGQLDLFFADGNAADSQAVWENGIASTNGGTKKRETSRSGSLDYTTIKNLKSVFRPDRDLSMLTASFQIADPLAGETSDAGKPVQFEMTRERQTTLRMTTRFSSPETVVSLSLLSRFAPFFKGFGDNCYFQGNAIFRTVDGVLPQREQTLELRNASFFNVSLESFLEKHLPFAVSG
ncbi:MAG: hypothetical protein FWC50_14795, partial [Planctomycetaceae bacterium]|nr:hypothetical protein [Planctomycetaceae bacterium]